MKKLFISQPMRGKTDEEILAVRKYAHQTAEWVLGEPVEVIDSYLHETPEVSNSALWCLGRSLELMADADVVYFVYGWEKYRGCRIEHECALEYSKDIIILRKSENYNNLYGVDYIPAGET